MHACTDPDTQVHTYVPEVCLSDLPEVVGSAQPLCKHPRVLGSEAEVDARHPVLDVVLGVKGGEVLAGRSASLGPLVSTFGLGRCGTAIYNTHRDTRQYTLLLSLPLQLMYLCAQCCHILSINKTQYTYVNTHKNCNSTDIHQYWWCSVVLHTTTNIPVLVVHCSTAYYH